MAGSGTWWVVGLLAALASSSGSVAVQSMLVVHVDDRAGVPVREAAAAKVIVEKTFRSAGVDVVWAEGRFPVSLRRSKAAFGDARHVAVMLVNNGEESTREATGCTLGFAAPREAVAYAFYNRIVEATERRPADVTEVLGRVIAHEIGHLLLPPNSHARYGIMRADLDFGFSNPNNFTEEQARVIRARVAAVPAGG
ncbi:MAG: hypothetical protein ACT4QD_12175 [Acidobacteriota bacterium]